MHMELITGDCREVMAAMTAAGGRVQCVITSPPYWGLRAYGNAACVWGGDPECEHRWSASVFKGKTGGVGKSTIGEASWGNAMSPEAAIRSQKRQQANTTETRTCGRCGAWYGELGHEGLHDCAGWATGEDCGQCYLCHLREVMRGIWSVLADDGIAWINLGDTYAINGGAGNQGKTGHRAGRRHTQVNTQTRKTNVAPKNLMLMPERFALAMQADGWIVRRDLIWSKPNAMPESTKDRPATAHEYVWMLVKQRHYYYDAEAVRELRTSDEDSRSFRGGAYVNGQHDNTTVGKRKDRGNVRVRAPAGWDTEKGAHGSVHRDGRAQEVEYREVRPGRNLRSVWTIATQPYKEAHYATFPPRLIVPMILASTRPGDVVFDPFAGTGTVAAEADRLGRRFAGAEINPENEALQAKRMNGPRGLEL